MTFTVYHKQSILEAVFHSLINSSNMHTSNNQLCWHITTCKNKFCTHYTVVSMLGQCVHYDSIRLSDYRCPCSANGFCTIHSVPQHHWQHKFNEWWLTLSDSSAQSNSQTQTHMHRHRHICTDTDTYAQTQTPTQRALCRAELPDSRHHNLDHNLASSTPIHQTTHASSTPTHQTTHASSSVN